MVTQMAPIAFFLPSLCGGGAERVMLTLANSFAARGLAVDLVLAKAVGPYIRDVSKDIRIVNLNSSRVLQSLPGLVRYLRREKPFALLSALNYANVVAFCAVRLSGQTTRLIVSEHSNLSKSSSAKTLTGKALRYAMQYCYARAHSVVAVSDGVADDLAAEIKLPRRSVKTIYNPVVTNDLLEKSINPIGSLVNDCIILAVGRLTKPKDYPTLLRAFARISNFSDAHLVILGDGELREELELLADDLGLREKVSMPGFVSNPYSWMRAASVFVMSSAWEGLPTALIEAMACGTPVVSTDCPSGPAEILENGRWGRLVPVGDPEAMAQAILETLSDSVAPDVSTRASAFGVEQSVESYLSLLSAPAQGMDIET